jgi:hypothetical protein
LRHIDGVKLFKGPRSMAIRRPSINDPAWLFQDFPYLNEGAENLRYLQVKCDGRRFYHTSHSFDYSNPPYSDTDQKGGPIVAQVDYSLVGQAVTIEEWWVNWRDEFPLRLAAQYLRQCLYPSYKNFAVRVNKEAYAFWVSEYFFPTTNDPQDFLIG